MLAFLAQYGAGLMIDGTATLTNTNVYTNQAEVRAHLPPFPRPLLQRPAGTLRVLAFCMQVGGGLFVYTGGVANLDGCNVYSNEAQVSARLMPRP